MAKPTLDAAFISAIQPSSVVTTLATRRFSL
jgi:hypothetical protein